MSFFSSLWSFLSVVVIAWITQTIIRYWEKRKKIEETKLAIYMSWMPYLAEWYAEAVLPTGASFDPRAFLKKKLEILGTLQIMGPGEAIIALSEFCDLAEQAFGKDPLFDEQKLHQKFTDLNYLLCCEIHGEKIKPELTWAAQLKRLDTAATAQPTVRC